jgi:hypothetical protein
LEFAELLVKLDDGMTQPKIIYAPNAPQVKGEFFKLANHKFWPSQDLRRGWRNYLGSPLSPQEEDDGEDESMDFKGSPKEGNKNALFILLKILDTITKQYVDRETEKLEKKARKEQMQAVGG